MAEKNPLSHIGASKELAKVAVFLASDEASYVNGIYFLQTLD